MHTLFCTATRMCSLGSTTLPSITHLPLVLALFFLQGAQRIYTKLKLHMLPLDSGPSYANTWISLLPSVIQFSLLSSDAHPPMYPGSLMTDLSLHKLLQRCHNPKWRHLGCASTTFLWACVLSGCAAQLRLPSLHRWHVWPRSAWCLALWQAHWIFSSCVGVRACADICAFFKHVKFTQRLHCICV